MSGCSTPRATSVACAAPAGPDRGPRMRINARSGPPGCESTPSRGPRMRIIALSQPPDANQRPLARSPGFESTPSRSQPRIRIGAPFRDPGIRIGAAMLAGGRTRATPGCARGYWTRTSTAILVQDPKLVGPRPGPPLRSNPGIQGAPMVPEECGRRAVFAARGPESTPSRSPGFESTSSRSPRTRINVVSQPRIRINARSGPPDPNQRPLARSPGMRINALSLAAPDSNQRRLAACGFESTPARGPGIDQEPPESPGWSAAEARVANRSPRASEPESP